MADSEPTSATDGLEDENDEQESTTNHIWLQILSQVHESRKKTAAGKQIVVLGDKRSGKSTLVAKLRGQDDSKIQVKLSPGLEYSYLDVRDDVREDSTRTAIWIVDGDSQYIGLLRHAISSVETLSNTLIVVCVPMTQLISVPEATQSWLNAFESSVVNRVRQTDEVAFNELQRAVERNWKLAANSFGKASDASDCDAQQGAVDTTLSDNDLKLEDGILQRNLGLPILFCVTKSDTIAQVEKEYELNDESLDIIQVQLRQLALKYGAGLIYTSANEEKNVELLAKYLQNQLYGTVSERSAYVVEKDCVFVPAGWDTPRKIAIMFENMPNLQPNASIDEVLAAARQRLARSSLTRQAASSSGNVAVELVVEDEQIFLTRMQSILSRAGDIGPQIQPPLANISQMQSPSAAASAVSITVSNSSNGTQPAVADISGSPLNRSAPVARPSSSGTQVATNERVLANFFNSLLTKKASTAGVAPTAADLALASDSDRVPNRKISMMAMGGSSSLEPLDKEKENQTS